MPATDRSAGETLTNVRQRILRSCERVDDGLVARNGDVVRPETGGRVVGPPRGTVEFFATYDAVLTRWPVPVEPVDVPSAYGTTRVNVSGPADGVPLVLLHGGGATSTVWFAIAGGLARTHRVYAIDQLGDVGRSVPHGRRITAAEDLMDWLDAVLDHLALPSTLLCGHSYGGWLALSYALHAPSRVRRLALLDPTDCLAGLRPAYRLRAVPLFVQPTASRMRSFLDWETGGARLDPGWLELTALGAGFRKSKIVLPRRPDTERLRALAVPTLVLLAEHSKAHDIRRVADTASPLLPHVTTSVLPAATHHTIPTDGAVELERQLLGYLAANPSP